MLQFALINNDQNLALIFIGAFIALLLLAIFLIVTLKLHVNQAILKSELSESQFEKLYLEQKTILKHLPVGVEIYSSDRKLLSTNDFDRTIFGLKGFIKNANGEIEDDEIKGLLDYEGIPMEIRIAISSHKKISTRFEYDFSIADIGSSKKNGILMLRCTGTPVISDAGVFEKYIFIIQDITEDYLISKELKEARLNLELSLKSAEMGVWSYSLAEDKFHGLYGKIIGKEACTLEESKKFVHPSGMEEFYELCSRLIKDREPEVKIIIPFNNHKNPISPLYIENQVTAINDAHGNIVKLIGTQRDVTDWYTQHKKLEANSRKTDLAIKTSGMAIWEFDVKHRIFLTQNNPLNNYNPNIPISLEYAISHYNSEDFGPDFMNSHNILIRGINSSFKYNMRVRMPGDLEWQYCTVIGVPLEVSPMGEVNKFVGIRQNNTQFTKLSKALSERNVQLNLVLKAGDITPLEYNTLSGIFRITSDGDNKKDSNAPEVNGIPYVRLMSYIHPDDQYNVEIGVEKLQNGECLQYKTEIRYSLDKNFSEYYEANFIGVNYNKEGKPTKLVGYLQNITSRKKMLSELQVAKEEAEQSSKLKSAFLANMSHEIRTPLNAIVGFSELLSYTDDEDEKSDYIGIIKTNNELLLRLINDILDLSKIEAGIIELKPEEFDLSSLFEDSYTSLRQKSLRPEVAFLKENPYSRCIVKLDKNRVMQIITNYTTNAIKYTPSGSITMGYVYENEGIKLYVRDTGIGVADDKKHKLFQRFEKLDDFAQGTGLGLSIVKAIANVGGGSVGVDTEPGKGSYFWAWIPCKADIVLAEKDDDTELDENGHEVENLLPLGLKFLILDDDTTNYKLLKGHLKDNILTQVSNIDDAINEIKADIFDCVIWHCTLTATECRQRMDKFRAVDQDTPILLILPGKVTATDFPCTNAIAINEPFSKAALRNRIGEALVLQ